ncbi:MAG: hypothetical protein JSR38_04480 [Proteobacteria bacterium]|nr:hypothetical protein [Pseudomonadota bacterium]
MNFTSTIRAVALGEGAFAPTLTEHEVASRLGTSHQELARYRSYGIGPVALLKGGAWLYFADSVAAWIEATAPINPE